MDRVKGNMSRNTGKSWKKIGSDRKETHLLK